MDSFAISLFSSILILSSISNSVSIVQLKQGFLRGTEERLPSGGKYQSYKGIPYAEPPIGNLRFKAPRPPKPWAGIKNATEHGPSCPQGITPETPRISEDCLTLNVYTRKNYSIFPKSVMVWFHGGGFFVGSGDSTMYGPEYLLEEYVVIVTVNYRLEVFGFLSLDIEEVPGNAGMKDQVMALKWVKENIEKFGGDPEKVTIFGESAGGASVTYHLVSPMSKGLFRGIITQSGSLFNDWALAPNASTSAYKLGKYLGFDTNDPYKLLKFFNNTPYEQFINVTFHLYDEHDENRSLPLYFCPTVEKTFNNEEVFLPKPAIELIKEETFNKVPILIGYNNNEGILFLESLLSRAASIEKDFTLKVPTDILTKVSNNTLQKIAKSIQNFYYGNESIGNNTLYQSCEMEGDFLFFPGIMRLAAEVSEVSEFPVYLYRFSADGTANLLKKISGYSFIKGATHGDDLCYLFKNSNVNLNEDSDEWKTMKQMTKMWTNFAKYGNPTPDDSVPIKWPVFHNKTMNYLEIDFELRVGQNPDYERFKFWKEIYDEYY